MKNFSSILSFIFLLSIGSFAKDKEPDKPKPPKTETEKPKASKAEPENTMALSSLSQQKLNAELHEQLNQALSNNPSLGSANLTIDKMEDLTENLSPAITEARFEAQSMFEFLDSGSGAGYKEEFDYGSLVQLPVGVKKTIKQGQGNEKSNEVAVGIHTVIFFPTHAEVTLFVKMTLKTQNPEFPNRELYFGAKNVRFTRNGGLQASFEAALLGDFIVDMGKWTVKFKGNDDIQAASPPGAPFACNPGSATGYCRVKIGCGAFEGATLAADVVFPRSVLVPFDETTGQVPATGRVTGSLIADVEATKGVNDLMACVTFKNKPFALPAHPSFGFKIGDLILDLSDTRNPTGITLVKNENNVSFVNDNTSDQIWRGFYASNIMVLLPQGFRKDNGETEHVSVEIGAQNLMIGYDGKVSGSLIYRKTYPVLTDQLNASGWSLDITYFQVNLINSKFTSAKFSSLIGIPLFSNGDSKLIFDGFIDANEKYTLTLGKQQNKSNIEANALRSRLNFSDFSVTLTYLVAKKKFLPSAKFSGTLNLISNVDQIPETAAIPTQHTTQSIGFKGIEFIDIELQTIEPKLKVHSVSYKNSSNKLGGYGVSLSKLTFSTTGFTKPEEEVATINIGISLNLMDPTPESGSSGNNTSNKKKPGGFSLIGEIAIPFKEKPTSILKYVPAGVRPVGAGVEGYIGNYKVTAQLYYQDIPGRKQEFRGEIGVFKTDDDHEVQSGGKFSMFAGHTYGTGGFRYFFIDGAAEFPVAIALVPPVSLKGLGGSFYYHVKAKKFLNGQITRSGPSTFLDYEEDKTQGLGYRIMVNLALGTDKAVSAKLFYELNVNKNNGFGKIGIWGVGSIGWDAFAAGTFIGDYSSKMNGFVDKFSGSVKDITNSGMLERISSNAGKSIFGLGGTPIELRMGAIWDGNTKTFHAYNISYINLGIIKGAGQQGRAGGSEIYFNNKDNIWYVNSGLPTNPNGVRVGFDNLGGSIGANFFCMVGNSVKEILPPPKAVIDALRLQPSDYELTAANKAKLASGGFMAVGLELYQKVALSVYFGGTEFKFQTGVNGMLAPKLLACEESNIYARGRAYAAISFLTWKRDGALKKVEISNVSGAGILEAGLVKPFYIRGQIGVTTRKGGKVVKTRMNSVSYGTTCF